MEIANLIKNKLLQYISHEISKENLYKWILELLQKLLKKDIFKITYLKVWGIITELATIDDMDDFWCDKCVRRFIRILSGEEDASFTFAFQIPKKFVLNDLLEIKKILQKYSQGKQLTEKEILELKFIAHKNSDAVNTLNEFIKLQIIDLINLGYEFGEKERGVEFSPKSTVFISEKIAMSLENDLLEKLILLLDCYNGERCFYVHTIFSNGIGNISIQV